MTTKNWKRAVVGACTATALAVGAGLAFAPVADAAPAAGPTGLTGTTGSTTRLLSGATTGASGVVGGVLGGTTSTPTTSSPVTTGTSSGGATVGVGGTTVGVTTGNGIGVAVGTGGGSGVGVQIGGTTTGVDVTGGVSGDPGTTTVTSTTTSTSTSSSSSTDSGSSAGSSTGTSTSGGGTSAPVSTAPATLSALSVAPQYRTVYPAKDGYRDTVAFQLSGTASDGLQHTASGTATLGFGSSTVRTWPITATNQTIVWNGLNGSRLVPGSYTFTAVIGDAEGHRISGSDTIAVSAKKIATATSVFRTKSVSGTHRMPAKPLAGLSKGRVTLRVVADVSGITGKQYLVFRHAGKKVEVRIRNGKHTSARVTIPRSFTTYTTSHTWKRSAVTIRSLRYKYSYKALK